MGLVAGDSRHGRASGEPLLNKLLGAGVQGLLGRPAGPPPADTNPIHRHFDVGPEVASAGHTLIWRVHRGYRKTDRQEVSIFILDKRVADKLFKLKRKESILERIRYSVGLLERWRHPRLLAVVHQLEESVDTLAFAAEPIVASLHNILAYQESCPLGETEPEPVKPFPLSLKSAPPAPPPAPPQRPPLACRYDFCEIELCYGIIQMIDALHFLHYTAKMVHRNLCPQNILVTKRGNWKVFGLEFSEHIPGADPRDPIPVPPWSMKVARIAQPLLDYTAPEVQSNAHCTVQSDIYSLGLVLCTIFNRGNPIIAANNNPILFRKQSDCLEKHIEALLPRLPDTLRDATQRMLAREPQSRPNTQLLPLINYFKEDGHDVVVALQLLDMVQFKEREGQNAYYRRTLPDALPKIPRKMRWATIWPALAAELRAAEASPFVYVAVVWFVNDASAEEFEQIVYPAIRQSFRGFVNDPRRLPGSAAALEHMHHIMRKCDETEASVDLLPLVYKALECGGYQLQLSALIGLQSSSELIEQRALGCRVVPLLRRLVERSPADARVVGLALAVLEKNFRRLEKAQVDDLVIPTLLAIKLVDPDIVHRTFNSKFLSMPLFYCESTGHNHFPEMLKELIDEPKFAISAATMAGQLLPALAPLTLNSGLNEDQFSTVMELLYQMLGHIERQRRARLARPAPPSSPLPERRRLRHQLSTDSVAPPFSIPNLRVEQRKTSSAEDMARRCPPAAAGAAAPAASVNSGASPASAAASAAASVAASAAETVTESFKRFGWMFGSSGVASPAEAGGAGGEGRFLRVSNVFSNRRLSDNTLGTPKIRVAPSCASSPGGSPGSALPARRHSSIGPQERRSSAVNLSPPTAVHQHRGRAAGSGSSLSVPPASRVGGSMPNTSSSVPHLLAGSAQSVRARRSSAGPPAAARASQGSAGLLQQARASQGSAGLLQQARASQGSAGLLQQLGAGAARRLPPTPARSPAAPWTALQDATAAGYNTLRQGASAAARKCPSLNISLVK